MTTKGAMIMSNLPFTSDTIGSTDYGASSMNANLDRKGGRIMSNDKRASDMSGAYGPGVFEDIVGTYGPGAFEDIVGACAYGRAVGVAVHGTSVGLDPWASPAKGQVEGVFVGAHKFRASRKQHRMHRAVRTGEMSANLDRKGGRIMSNASLTSAQTGSDGIAIGAALADPAMRAHVLAAAKVDQRIKAVSVPYFAASYDAAVNATDLGVYNANAMRVMAGLLDDDGIRNFGNVEVILKQFGTAQNFERAIMKRLGERGKYLGAF